MLPTFWAVMCISCYCCLCGSSHDGEVKYPVARIVGFTAVIEKSKQTVHLVAFKPLNIRGERGEVCIFSTFALLYWGIFGCAPIEHSQTREMDGMQWIPVQCCFVQAPMGAAIYIFFTGQRHVGMGGECVAGQPWSLPPPVAQEDIQ